MTDATATLQPDGTFRVSVRVRLGPVFGGGDVIQTRRQIEAAGWRFAEEPRVGVVVRLEPASAGLPGMG